MDKSHPTNFTGLTKALPSIFQGQTKVLPSNLQGELIPPINFTRQLTSFHQFYRIDKNHSIKFKGWTESSHQIYLDHQFLFFDGRAFAPIPFSFWPFVNNPACQKQPYKRYIKSTLAWRVAGSRWTCKNTNMKCKVPNKHDWAFQQSCLLPSQCRLQTAVKKVFSDQMIWPLDIKLKRLYSMFDCKITAINFTVHVVIFRFNFNIFYWLFGVLFPFSYIKSVIHVKNI